MSKAQRLARADSNLICISRKGLMIAKKPLMARREAMTAKQRLDAFHKTKSLMSDTERQEELRVIFSVSLKEVICKHHRKEKDAEAHFASP